MSRFTPWVLINLVLFVVPVSRIAAAEEQLVTGIVAAAPANAKEAAVLKVGTAVYKITRDAKGTVVAANAKNEKVQIKGTLEEKDGVKWLTVIWCKIVE